MAKLIIKLKNGNKNLFKSITESSMGDHLRPCKVDPFSFKLNDNLTTSDVFQHMFNNWLQCLNFNGIKLNDLEIESISSEALGQGFLELLKPKKTQLTQETINDFYTLIYNAKDYVLHPTISSKSIDSVRQNRSNPELNVKIPSTFISTNAKKLPAAPSGPSPIPPKLIEERKALDSTLEHLTTALCASDSETKIR